MLGMGLRGGDLRHAFGVLALSDFSARRLVQCSWGPSAPQHGTAVGSCSSGACAAGWCSGRGAGSTVHPSSRATAAFVRHLVAGGQLNRLMQSAAPSCVLSGRHMHTVHGRAVLRGLRSPAAAWARRQRPKKINPASPFLAGDRGSLFLFSYTHKHPGTYPHTHTHTSTHLPRR